ncbi:MAG: DUF1266 domain-containing protein [Lachnospiraceae bacterium]|nr:DUF1266 domain-containing protein [Lachnospiraceae bacterium]
MKKGNVILLAAAIGLILTACGNSKDTENNVSNGTTVSTGAEENKRAEESQEPENLPDSQEYLSSDGTYKVILLEGLTQTDMQIPSGGAMMGLDGDTARTGFSSISLRCAKSNVPGNSGDIESLEDFADYITDMTLNGTGVTVDWVDTEAPSLDGAERCLAWEGVAKSGTGRGQAYGYYAETADSYFMVVIVGNNDDVEEARQVIALELLDEAPIQAGTKGFINGMTAILDSVNGASVSETFKALEDAGATESQLDAIASQARQSLSGSWGVENADDLIEMADWLMAEGHNQDALDALKEYNADGETQRDAFDAKLKEQGLDDGTYISLLAAYDAQSAYGDGAIAAWDLSRVGTIMGFGYASGYCTYEEAMDKILEAAQKAQELFDSWEDFNKSYLYGYSYWSEESLDDSQSSAAERAELVSGMEAQANGPFSVDWNIELKKEW